MTKPRFVFSLLFKITLLVVAAMTAVIGVMTYDVTRAIRENAVAELTKSNEVGDSLPCQALPPVKLKGKAAYLVAPFNPAENAISQR